MFFRLWHHQLLVAEMVSGKKLGCLGILEKNIHETN